MTENRAPLGDARVVIVGGGIAGCSAAYHLAALGLTDVLLLERASLSSGTTWHSTGSMETYRDNPLIYEMVRYTVSSFPRLQEESGQLLGWRNLGRVMYTDCEARYEIFRTLPELGRSRGIEIELLSPRGVAERLPIIEPAGLVGGVWVPSDGCVNPTDVVTAYAKAARARGVRVRENVRVIELVGSGGRIRGVVTDQGVIGCDAVVIAAGRWSNAIAGTIGASLPLHALEHQYIITEPIPGLPKTLPLLLSYDDRFYGREEVGGIIIGSFDSNAIPVASPNEEGNSAFMLLNERWDQFEPYMKTALRRFPVLASTGIKMLLNGPESFTPDGEMLLGPVPGIDGLYSLCGFNSNGIALSPAAGKFIAEWIIEGEPSADVAQLDVRRFAIEQASDAYIRERVTEVPEYVCTLHGPLDDYRTSRDVRRSPVHAELAASGARFASVAAWERPLIIDSAASGTWIDAVVAETAAAHHGALLVDRSADVKVALIGAEVWPWLAKTLGMASLADDGRTTIAAFPGAHGQVEAFGRILPWDGGVLLTAGPEQATRVPEWLRRTELPPGARWIDVTSGWAIFELAGPAGHEVLSSFSSTAMAAGGHATALWVGAARIQVHSDPVHASTLLFVPADYAVYVWRHLLGAAGGAVRVGGHYAQEALRIARGIPRFGQEATPATRVVDVVGSRQSVPARRPSGRLLTALAGPAGLPGFATHESILHEGKVIAHATSRAWLPGWPQMLALTVLPTDRGPLVGIELAAAGKRWPLSRRATVWQPGEVAQ